MKWLSLIKNFYVVWDEYSKTHRISESMVTNTVILISSILVYSGVMDVGFEQQDVAAISAGIMSVIGIIVRLRSKGGKLAVHKKS